MSFRFWARTALAGAALGGAVLVAAYKDDFNQLPFDVASNVMPLVQLLDGEQAHHLAIWAASHGLVPRDHRLDPTVLRSYVWGRHFANPIGLAAGFDKDAEAVRGMLDVGFGFTEIGSVTPLPQPGNPKPRVFRLPEFMAIINRYGFNSKGVDYASERLAEYRNGPPVHVGDKGPPGIVGVNLGKNKTSEDAAADYSVGVAKLATYADYLVINVSSPNTPGLRALQGRAELEQLVKRVKAARDALEWGVGRLPPLLVKIAPDLSRQDKADIAAVVLKTGVDGLVISNTTLARPPEAADIPSCHEAGGLSGRPLFEPSTEVLREMYRLTKGQVPIIGVGGVFSGEDAYRKIRAGASLVQVYTALAYEGPALVPRVKAELADLLQRDGFASVSQAVGADHPDLRHKRSSWLF